EFMVRDFEDTWDALAGVPSARNRGNFMFARQAMVLLEWAARLAATDTTGGALSAFSTELHRIEPRYFTTLPCDAPSPNEFRLPSVTTANQERQLIWTLFDLVRHGQAHQYQQIPVELLDGNVFWIALSGAASGFQLATAQSRRKEHLGYKHDPSGNVWLLVRTDLIFLDLKNAVEQSNLLGRRLSFRYLERPRRSSHYQCDSKALKAALSKAGHPVNPI
ncbi:MAG: hypothetical protein ACE5HB_08230, partial [Terriglobia bacterium]